MNENFKFGGRLTQNFPSQIIVDITELCNLECIHCPHVSWKKTEHYSGAFLDPELNKKMVDEVGDVGKGSVQYIRYTSNGEPLIHPKAYELIQYAVDHSNTYVTLTTNGTILSEKRIRKLIESGIHMIDISIDAYHPETYSKIRVKGDLEVTRTNVMKLIKWVSETKAETKVIVSYVEQEENKLETGLFEEFWRNQGADAVVIRRLHSAGGAQEENTKKLWDSYGSMERYPCLYPWERLTLNARGELAFCPTDWLHASAFADYREVSIHEIWQGNFMKELREAHKSGCFKKHEFCGKCPDWAETRWPHQGKSYADLVTQFKESRL